MNTKPKDSFERFGDDLTELLLTYLPFEDKFRYEPTSRQWQRLMFNKVDELIVFIKLNSVNINRFDPSMYPKLCSDNWQSVFRKCRNISKVVILIAYKFDKKVNENIITENDNIIDVNEEMVINQEVDESEDNEDNGVEIDNDDYEIDNLLDLEQIIDEELVENINKFRIVLDKLYEQMIVLVVNECRQLTHFTSYGHSVNEKIISKMIDKFGSKLKLFNFPFALSPLDEQIKQLLPSMPRLQRVNDWIHIDDIIIMNDDDTDEDKDTSNLITKQLKRIHSHIDDDYSVEMLALFANICRKRQIKLLDFKLFMCNDNVVIDRVVDCFKCFSSLINMSIYVDLNEQHLSRQQLKQLVDNCPKMKQFTYKSYDIHMDYKTLVSDINEVFGSTHVTKIAISGKGFTNKNIVLTSDMFNRCRQLTRLTITGVQIQDQFFDNLAANLPKLCNLRLCTVILTDRGLQSLSKLQRLIRLTVKLSPQSQYSESELMYLETRPKFKHFIVRKYI